MVSLKRPGQVDPTRLFLSLFFSSHLSHLPFFLFSLYNLTLSYLDQTKATMANVFVLSSAPCTTGAATNLGSGSLFLPLGCSFFSLPLSFFFSHQLGSISLSRPMSLSRLLPLLGTRLSPSHLDWTKAMSWLWGLMVDYGL